MRLWLLVLFFLTSCATMPQAVSTGFSCDMPEGEEIVCYSKQDCSNIMYSVGAYLANQLYVGKIGKEHAVDLNLYMDYVQTYRIGKAWLEKRDDGSYYLCEDYIYCNIMGEQVSDFSECFCLSGD